MEAVQIVLSRLQFGATASFHIIFPCLIIGLAFYLSTLEILWWRTKREMYKIQYEFWVKIFAAAFIIGVITGVVLSYQLDTAFGGFYLKTLNVLVPIRQLEFANAVILEAGCFGIMVWGWQRVGNRLHLLATLMVTAGVVVSVTCILARNSWMQTPAGFEVVNGEWLLADRLSAILSPSFPYRFVHMLGAAFLSTAFMILGISAWFLLRRRNVEFARFSLRAALLVIVVLVPFQFVSGDLHGLNTKDHQPAKIAAIEGLWETREGAPMVLFGLPDQEGERNRYAVEIPKLASLMLTHELNGKITGLKDVPKEERPNVPLVFFSFRVMVAMGVLMAGIAIVGLILLRRHQLYDNRWFLRACCLTIPSGFIATIAGWCVTEAGRQPWVVYGLVKTAEVAVARPASEVLRSLGVIGSAYAVLLVAFSYFIWRLVRQGPGGSALALDESVATGNFAHPRKG